MRPGLLRSRGASGNGHGGQEELASKRSADKMTGAQLAECLNMAAGRIASEDGDPSFGCAGPPRVAFCVQEHLLSALPFSRLV
jgi:hypothetical protein